MTTSYAVAEWARIAERPSPEATAWARQPSAIDQNGTDSLIHGDYKSDHVLVSSAGLALIDVDRAGPGDRALDLAKFLADLHWWLAPPPLGPAPDVAVAQAAFLAGYGEVGRELLRRARILEAVLVLRLAARRPGLQNANWATLTEALVSRAERLSEGWGRE